MTVNIVMLVHNRHRLTWQTLKTLNANTPPELFNLTIIDDASVDTLNDADPLEPSLNSMVRMHDNFVTLRISPSKGITGQARNLGVYWAEKYWGRGDYLYLSDNDVYFTPGWLNRLLDAFDIAQKENLKVLGGWNHPFLQSQDRWPFGIRLHDAIAGASQLMKWETWDAHGPLDANAAGVCRGEDWQFCQNIIKAGGRVGSIYPRVVFNCGLTNSYGEPSVGADVVLKELQEAKKQYPEMYWE